MIWFPEQYRTNTMELPVVAAISAALSGLAGFFSSVAPGWVSILFIVAATIILLPAVAIISYWLYAGAWNFHERVKWSGSFDGRLSTRRALSWVRRRPDQYVLFVQLYSGGFDASPLAPAAILEDQAEGKRFAIFPSSWKIIDGCKEQGVPVVRNDGRKAAE